MLEWECGMVLRARPGLACGPGVLVAWCKVHGWACLANGHAWVHVSLRGTLRAGLRRS